jgi:hypothetical protein
MVGTRRPDRWMGSAGEIFMEKISFVAGPVAAINPL